MLRRLASSAWGIYVWLLFATVLSLAVLCAVLLPTVRLRRDGSRALARMFFILAGLPFSVHGAERLPVAQSVVVANHTSYIDGPLLYAALPSRFGFVIKKEVMAIPMAGWLLGRLGHEFVDRHNKSESAKDARRILRAAFRGGSVAFFPEGTFGSSPGLASFHSGAFVTAAKAGMAVVPGENPAIQLADRIAALAPVAGSKVFFTSGGSDSVDSAAKLARRYFAETGEPDRRVLITRTWAYHGMHGYGTSLAGIEGNLEPVLAH